MVINLCTLQYYCKYIYLLNINIKNIISFKSFVISFDEKEKQKTNSHKPFLHLQIQVSHFLQAHVRNLSFLFHQRVNEDQTLQIR